MVGWCERPGEEGGKERPPFFRRALLPRTSVEFTGKEWIPGIAIEGCIGIEGYIVCRGCVRFRVDYEFSLLIHQCLHGNTPSYLKNSH